MRRLALVGLVSVLVSACEKKEPPSSASESVATGGSASSKAAAKEAPSTAPTGSVAPKKVEADRTLHAFVGTIGKDQKIRIYLERRGDELTGLYVAEGGAVHVRVAGKVKSDNAFELRDVAEKGTQSLGTFSGWFRRGLLKGSYQDAKTKKTYVFTTEPLKLGPQPFTSTYAGALGSKLRIRAKLSRKGTNVEGVYRYVKSKEDLQLSGTLDDEGELKLTEKTKAGKETGRVEAFALSPSLIVGRWSSPDGSKSMPLLLEPSDSYPEVVDLGAVKVAPQEEYVELAKNCTSSLLYPVVDGAKGKATLNPALRKELGGHMEKSACEGATPDLPYVTEGSYHVGRAKLPWFGITFSTYWSTGGAHPGWSSTCKIANADTGELFALAGKMTKEARAKLAELVKKKLLAEHGVEKLSDAGFFEDELTISDTTNVCLGDKGGLVVDFNPYEITPWVMGAPEVAITKEEAKPLVPEALAPLVE